MFACVFTFLRLLRLHSAACSRLFEYDNRYLLTRENTHPLTSQKNDLSVFRMTRPVLNNVDIVLISIDARLDIIPSETETCSICIYSDFIYVVFQKQ